MALIYDRKYELVFGTPAVETSLSIPPISDELAGSGYVDYNTEPSDARLISDLHIEATFVSSSKSNGSVDSENVIKIYNLSPETESVLYKEGAYIQLRAGYATDEELPTLFAGQVKQVFAQKQGLDRVTHVVCGNGYIPKKNARISLSYPNTTPKASIIRDITLRFPGISLGYLEVTNLEDEFYQGGRSFSGRLTIIMDTVCRENGLTWSIDKNKIYVYPRIFKGAIDPAFKTLSARAYNLNPSNMLSLKKERDNAAVFSSDDKAKGGVTIHMFLDGRVTQNDFIQLDGTEYDGLYKVDTVKHNLSWRGSDWTTHITARSTDT